MSPRVRPSAGPAVLAPHSTVETIAAAYLEAAGQDPHAAIRRVIEDALVDLCEAERRVLRRDRLISHGYVRRGLPREEVG